MESMVNMQGLFGGIYKGKKVLLTGHTGFKGSWMMLWLQQMGAEVVGFSLKPEAHPNHYEILGFRGNSYGDIRDKDLLNEVLEREKPDVVFHLAAQSLVRPSYHDPLLTYETNVMGTLNLLDACRKQGSVTSIINVTSDKCYENNEWVWGYRENDPMGGHDPYSSSKGCSELLTASFRNSFFNLDSFGKEHTTLIATARAGNVIGGGDWAVDRLIPDIMSRANVHEKVVIRSPNSTRPWQHVLEPISGYLLLGSKLLQGKKEFAQAWNFGPGQNMNLSVEQIVELAKQYWNLVDYEIAGRPSELHEANLLTLDCSKSRIELNWESTWGKSKTLEKTVTWYRDYYSNGTSNSLSDIESFVIDALKSEMKWIK